LMNDVYVKAKNALILTVRTIIWKANSVLRVANSAKPF
jgi:hypothetical protein